MGITNLTFDTSCIVSLRGDDASSADEVAALRKIRHWHDEGKVRIWGIFSIIRGRSLADFMTAKLISVPRQVSALRR